MPTGSGHPPCKAWGTFWLQELCDFGHVTHMEFSLSFLICKMKKKKANISKGLKTDSVAYVVKCSVDVQ